MGVSLSRNCPIDVPAILINVPVYVPVHENENVNVNVNVNGGTLSKDEFGIREGV